MATIMVVDDEYVIRNLLKQVLKLGKHTVLEAPDGREALRLIDPASPPDLIIMDHQMPHLSGIECAKAIKNSNPSQKIVLVSGSFGNYDDGYLLANKHLFDDIILKPFQIRDVVSTVTEALGCPV